MQVRKRSWMLHDRNSVDPIPQVRRERSEFGLYAEVSLRIGARGLDFQPVADDSRVLEQLFEPAVRECRHRLRVEVCKRPPVTRASVEEACPGRPGRRAAEGRLLTPARVVART